MVEAPEATEQDIHTAGTAKNFTTAETLGCYGRENSGNYKGIQSGKSCMELQQKKNEATIPASTVDSSIATPLHKNKIPVYTMLDYLERHFVEIPNFPIPFPKHFTEI